MTIAIGVICTLVQLVGGDDVIYRYGWQTDGHRDSLALLTSAFVHAGWFHLIGNMLFLWLVASVLEDRWGGAKFALFYVASAIAANLAFAATYHGPPITLVGASGAISGVMGAFLVYYARTEIKFWYWMMRAGTGTFELPAYFALPFWLVEQIVWFYFERDLGGVSGTAYAAHIGGFVFGVAFALATNVIFGKRAHEDDDEVEPPLPIAAVEALPNPPRARRESITADTYAAQARAADGDPAAFYLVAARFDHEFPTSPQLPAVLWRLAEHQRDAGRVDDAIATLESLARRFPDDPSGVRAADALRQRPSAG